METGGTDAGQAGTFDPPFPNHTFMLPVTDAVVIAAPLKIVNGTDSPLRVLALVED